MLLNFDEMTPVPMEHFKGGVGTLQVRPYDDGNCKVLQMTLPQGTSIGLHTHEGSCEMIFVLSGEGNTDSAVAVLGLMAGAAFAHNFGLASSGEGPTANGKLAVVIGIAVVAAIACFNTFRKEES